MAELFQIMKNILVIHPEIMTWGVAVILLLMGFISQSTQIKEYTAGRKLEKLLKNAGQESLHDITISNGIDDKIFIEYLILTPEKIILLGVNKYYGLIYAAENIDLWTQIIGNKSYKFANPFHQLESNVRVLNSFIENSKIEKKVLFIKGSEFPKGKPDNVVSIRDIEKWSENSAAKETPNHLRTDWEKLVELADNSDTHGNRRGIKNNKIYGMNITVLISMATVIFLWLVLRLMY